MCEDGEFCDCLNDGVCKKTEGPGSGTVDCLSDLDCIAAAGGEGCDLYCDAIVGQCICGMLECCSNDECNDGEFCDCLNDGVCKTIEGPGSGMLPGEGEHQVFIIQFSSQKLEG